MNEPLPRSEDTHLRSGPPAPVPTAAPIAYQPISGWAIAGLGVSALFTVLVAISTIVALAQGAPMFFPAWILGLALVGIVFSLIGQRQIQDSEGTRAGAKLARVGIWLSLVSGLGYLSYFYVTGLALQAQANAFVMDKGDDSGFFPRLIEGGADPAQVNAAFLLTLPANARSGRPDDPVGMVQLHDTPGKDGSPGPLTQFREGPLVRIFYGQLAKDAAITPLGVQDWKYEMRSYKIYRAYRIKTRELEVEALLAVVSTEADAAGKERKWFVNMRESGPQYPTLKLTPTGKGIRVLRGLAQVWLHNLGVRLNEGRPFADIEQKDESNWSLVHVRSADRAAVRKLVYDRFRSSEPRRFQLFNAVVGREEMGKWGMNDGKVRIDNAFRAIIQDHAKGTSYTVVGNIVLETKTPVDPAQFTEATVPLPEWNIVSIIFTQILPPAGPERKG